MIILLHWYAYCFNNFAKATYKDTDQKEETQKIFKKQNINGKVLCMVQEKDMIPMFQRMGMTNVGLQISLKQEIVNMKSSPEKSIWN